MAPADWPAKVVLEMAAVGQGIRHWSLSAGQALPMAAARRDGSLISLGRWTTILLSVVDGVRVPRTASN